jgi:transcriptional regulator with XRE-family HTH domain
MDIFSKRLLKLRKEKHMTQEQVGQIIGVRKTAISRYENGREADYDTLVKIAQYFDVSTDYLLGLVDVRQPWAEPSPHIPVGDMDAEQIRKIEDYARLVRSDQDKQ